MAGTMTGGKNPGPSGAKSGWRFFPLAVALGLSFVAAVNTYMIVNAMRTFPGELANGYDISNSYNHIMFAEREQVALGWKVVLFGKSGHVAVHMTDREGLPLGGLTLKAKARRPVGPESTTELTFESDGAGHWISTRPLDLGQWLVDVTATAPGRDYVITRRVIIR